MAKILPVDDERNVLRSFEALLSPRGHAVVTMHDAEDAIRRLWGVDCKLVISDICLPGMNCVCVSVRILQFRHMLPVIVMTGQDTAETTIEATKRGSFD
jgi:DNA-binding NtrC family response regulator